ncbi:unnamed protein product [Microthlaspi erraticum]|uniref:Uncharacterized protein n=1 Tax=Microthlaspi erraticum TaxID=1685480 RepID=A0A6D2KHG6_9BRAS|nr:unnamed protein product [Microthlaspi erraticum]
MIAFIQMLSNPYDSVFRLLSIPIFLVVAKSVALAVPLRVAKPFGNPLPAFDEPPRVSAWVNLVKGTSLAYPSSAWVKPAPSRPTNQPGT